jgi:hypothetical protein
MEFIYIILVILTSSATVEQFIFSSRSTAQRNHIWPVEMSKVLSDQVALFLQLLTAYSKIYYKVIPFPRILITILLCSSRLC